MAAAQTETGSSIDPILMRSHPFAFMVTLEGAAVVCGATVTADLVVLAVEAASVQSTTTIKATIRTQTAIKADER